MHCKSANGGAAQGGVIRSWRHAHTLGRRPPLPLVTVHMTCQIMSGPCCVRHATPLAEKRTQIVRNQVHRTIGRMCSNFSSSIDAARMHSARCKAAFGARLSRCSTFTREILAQVLAHNCSTFYTVGAPCTILTIVVRSYSIFVAPNWH